MKETKEIKIYNLIWYFIIFSILGMVIETLYCYITTGVIESRKGLIWGPFCPVYGVGAVVLIYALNRYKKNWLLLFITGTILGSVVEYILSFGLEAIYGIRFWEYSYIAENLNGRICIPYSIFWGMLSILVIEIVKPLIDKIINLIPQYFGKKLEIALIIFLTLDTFCTIYAIEVCKNNILLLDNEIETENYIEKNLQNIGEQLFPTEKVLKTFPNLRVKNNGKEIFIRDLIENK